MNKRILLIVLPVFLFGIGIAVYYFLSSSKTKPTSPLSQKQTVNKLVLPSKETKTYTDDSGFTFSYPNDLVISKTKTTDDATYAALSITSAKTKGMLSFKAISTDAKTADDWTLKNSSGSASVSDAKLGDFQSKMLQANDKTTLVAIDQGVLFLIELSPKTEKEYWKQVLKTITESFSITQPTTSLGNSSPSSDSDIDYEGEEAVE